MYPAAIFKSVSSWDEFQTLLRQLPNTKAKGDAFEHLCLAFLRTDPRYVSDLKTVWLRKQVPAAVAKRLNLPDTDEGIDGIAETRDGQYWAFQCKYLDNPSHALTKNTLDGFSHLALTHCKGVTKALVLHTSAAPIRKHRLLGISEVGLREFESLEGNDWKGIQRALKPTGTTKKTPPRKPRPHQAAAVKAITKHFKEHDRGRVLMACGSGKSLVGFWVQQSLRAKQIVVAVPSLSLLNQTLKEWATEWIAHGETVRYTAVCSDESAADVGSSDAFVAHAYELGIDTYTDTRRITERLKAMRREHHVIFTTYQSSHRLAAAARRAGVTFDLGILDEAHKTVGQRGDRFTTLLDDKAIRIRKRMAMTATERVLRGDNDDVLSMDDPKVYGEVAYLYTFKQAIKDRVICDYKVVTLAVAESKIKSLIQENRRVLLQGRGKQDRMRLAQDVAAGELLAKAFESYGVRHAISFHRSIDAASGFTHQWDAMGQMVKRRVQSSAFHVSSKLPTGKRVELLRHFRDANAALISNARCLTEGVDVPNVDAVLFADPRKSTIDIVQAVGRALRKNKNKRSKIGYVLLPVVVPTGQSIEQFLNSNSFKEVGRVIATLSTHDERIAEEFRVNERGETKASHRRRIEFIGDVSLGVRLDAPEFAAKCRARIWRRVGRLNWRPLPAAKRFVHKLKLESYQAWTDYCAGTNPGLPPRPADVPKAPHCTYPRSEWTGYGDWLGTGRIHPANQQRRSFEEAREWVRALKLRTRREWIQFCAGQIRGKPKLPSDIPTNPARWYRQLGWNGFGDWLGSRTRSTALRKYALARKFVRNLRLSSLSEWQRYCRGEMKDKTKLPLDIPKNPQSSYKHLGWLGFGDWLGNGKVKVSRRRLRSFNEARRFVRSLHLNSQSEWFQYCAGRIRGKPKCPNDIPVGPANYYRGKGWQGFGDWLGTGRLGNKNRQFRSFESARSFARRLGLKSRNDWRRYIRGDKPNLRKLPSDIPKFPNSGYRECGWQGWGDWLGTGNVFSKNWRTFESARKFVRRLRLQNVSEWRAYCVGSKRSGCSKPSDIPFSPDSVYRSSGWISYGDWLGTGTVSKHSRRYRPYDRARSWVRKLGLRNMREWSDYCGRRAHRAVQKPDDIPAAPQNVYRNSGWTGSADWLGVNRNRETR